MPFLAAHLMTFSHKNVLQKRWMNGFILGKEYFHSHTTTNNYYQRTGKTSEEFNHIKRSMTDKPPDGIYVQVLPVVLSSEQEKSHAMKSSKNMASECKILLCKWNSGDFKDRYTGLIKPLPRKEYDIILSYDKNRKSKEKHDLLLQSAKDLIPSPLQQVLRDIRLVGLLRFQDPPVYDEYIYLANLLLPKNNDHDYEEHDSGRRKEFYQKEVAFEENSCHWFAWDKIPFHEMPADDELWYPKVLQEQLKVQGSFTFGGWSEKTIKSFELKTVPEIE